MTTMTEPPRGFDRQEFEARTARAQELMRARGITAMLLTTQPEIYYFTGFQTQFWQSPTRPWFVIVPASGKPVAIIPEIGAALMSRSWLDDIRTWPAPQPDDDGVSILTATLRECAGDGDIGVPMGPETHVHMPLGDYERVRDALGANRFVDATDIIRTLRMVKSEAEIDKIRHICQIASRGFERLQGELETGMSEIDVFRAFRRATLAEGADDVPFLVGSAEEGGYADIISPASDEPIREGDVLILDNGSVFDGYFCDFDRNFGFDKVSDDALKAYETCYRATEAGIAAARPGATCADLFHAMSAVLDAGGALGNDVGRLGHGLGLQLTEWPSHAPFDQTVLKAGMVITIEPGMTFAPGKLMVHEENIVVRDGPAELLTIRAAPELPIIG